MLKSVGFHLLVGPVRTARRRPHSHSGSLHEIFLRYFLSTFFWFSLHHDVLDSCPLAAQSSRFHLPGHFAAEGYLAGHGCVGTHLALGDGWGDAGGDGDSG